MSAEGDVSIDLLDSSSFGTGEALRTLSISLRVDLARKVMVHVVLSTVEEREDRHEQEPFRQVAVWDPCDWDGEAHPPIVSFSKRRSNTQNRKSRAPTGVRHG